MPSVFVYLLKYDLGNWVDNTSQNLEKIIGLLTEQGYITIKENQHYKDLTKENVNLKGVIASQVNECNELLMTELLTKGVFDDLDEAEICGLLGDSYVYTRSPEAPEIFRSFYGDIPKCIVKSKVIKI